MIEYAKALHKGDEKEWQKNNIFLKIVLTLKQ